MLQRENKTTTKSSSFFKPTIQKKLSIGSANDSYEVEADNMANKVMRMSESSTQNISHTGSLVQRKCTACEQEEKIQKKSLAENITPFIQRSSNFESGGQAPNHVESQINSSRGGGSRMDNGTKNFMESRFGTDFSNVKIHTGSQAVQMSRELNAQAFTVGNDIYFNEGKYSPNSDSGKHLLAHELTHTVQQSGGVERKVQRDYFTELSNPDAVFEGFNGEQIDDAIEFNQRQSYSTSDIALYRDVLGLSSEPSVFDEDLINSIGEYQAQNNLTIDGKMRLGGPTARRLARELNAEGRYLGGREGAELIAAHQRLCPRGVTTVTIDLVKLYGATRNPNSDLRFANTVFDNCCVRFQVGQSVTATQVQTTSWLGGDTTLQRIHSCSTPHAEEVSLLTNATATFGLTSRYRVFYMANMLPALNGVNFSPDCSSGARAPFNRHLYISNSANQRTLAHELGHIPIVGVDDHTTHGGTARNLMIPNGPGSELTSRQCNEVQTNI